MKPKLLLLCGLIGLTMACAGPENRPITEDMPLDEMNSLLKDEPDYQVAIQIAEAFRKDASTIEMAKINDLTYKGLHTFLKSYLDVDIQSHIEATGEQEWREKFENTYGKVDSLLEYWKKHLDQNKPNSYVRVTLERIDPEESSYGAASVILSITPLKGRVDKVGGSFGLFPRGTSHSFGDFSSARHNNFAFENGLTIPVTHKTWMQYSIWDITDGDIPYSMYPDRKGLPLDELLEKYWFDYNISELVKDGKQIRYADIYLAIPSSIRNYWEEDDMEFWQEYRCGEIIRELFDAAFIDRTTYTRDYKQAYYRELDPLAAWLMFDRRASE